MVARTNSSNIRPTNKMPTPAQGRGAIVYVANKSGHDFSPAERFGTLVYLTEGPINKFAANQLYRSLAEKLNDSQPGDYLLVTSLAIINAVAGAMLGRKHGRVNFLLYRAGEYIERKVHLDNLMGDQDDRTHNAGHD